ncbi:MAG TPA: hypothetical protein VHI77_01140 [Solirubrobacterales bacterium]|nr:hypothetical protein [Solirubrobacterales bacterium]
MSEQVAPTSPEQGLSEVAGEIVRDLRPTSVLGAGGGAGSLVEALRERGVEASGVDSPSEPLDRRYDLIVCIEALEDAPPAERAAAIANLCGATDQLMVLAEDWSAALAGEGFYRDLDRDLACVNRGAVLYTRTGESVEELVRRYDRSLARLHREAVELRESRGEILRLRDLLIGMEAELGLAKGRVTELEAQTSGLFGLKRKLLAKVAGLRALLGSARRRFGGD